MFEIRKLENTEVFRTDLKQIFEFIKCSSDKKKLRQLVQSDPAYQAMEEDAYDMAVQYTSATELIAMKSDYEMGGKVNMCKALTEMLADERQEGFEEGVLQGIEQGIERGIEQGIEQGIERGIEQGIQQGTVQCIDFFVLEYLEDGISPERIAEKLMRGFSMTREEAEKTVERYKK